MSADTTRAATPAHTATPGPWRTVPSTAHEHAGTTRLDVVSDGTEFAPSYVAGDILPEDARLMAAAPDLLEALRLCVSACRDRKAHGLDEALAITIAEAAIAKAEGRE